MRVKTKQQEELEEQIMFKQAALATRWRELVKVTPTVQNLFAEYEQAARALTASANTTRAQAERYAADDTIYPAGRQRLIAETLAKGKAEHAALAAKTESLLTILKSELAHVATPRIDSRREMAARDELRLILDNAADPLAAMAEVANRGGELAGVACSSYGESYLRAKGTRNPKEAHSLVLQTARAAAVNSDDAQLAGAAKVYHALAEPDGVDGVRACTLSIARMALSAAEDAGAGL